MKQLFLLASIAALMFFFTSCSKSSAKTGGNPTSGYTSVTSGTGTPMPYPKTDLNVGYMGSAVMGGNMFLGGGDSGLTFSPFVPFPANSVEIYNIAKGSWSTSKLSVARDGLAIGSVGSKVFFAGGVVSGAASSLVDIYDGSTNTWSTANLSLARFAIGVAAAGTKILFAGGSTYNTGVFNFNEVPSNVVDIYDASTNTWSASTLPQSKSFCGVASLGNKIVFAGGQTVSGGNLTLSSEADIFDVSTNSWSTAQIGVARTFIAGASAGNEIIFGGGLISGYFFTNVVDIYNISTGAWTSDTLSQARDAASATGAGNLVFIGGGESSAGPGIPATTGGIASATVDIYNTTTGKWLTPMQLSAGKDFLGSGSSGNTVVFAGG